MVGCYEHWPFPREAVDVQGRVPFLGLGRDKPFIPPGKVSRLSFGVLVARLCTVCGEPIAANLELENV